VTTPIDIFGNHHISYSQLHTVIISHSCTNIDNGFCAEFVTKITKQSGLLNKAVHKYNLSIKNVCIYLNILFLYICLVLTKSTGCDKMSNKMIITAALSLLFIIKCVYRLSNINDSMFLSNESPNF
jgi:hypothetical protein